MTDANGAPVAGVTVAFTASGATVNPASVATDAQGRASTTVSLGSAVGPGAVTATVAGLPAVSAALTIATAVTGPAVSAVVNGASFQRPLAGGSWITVYIDKTAAAPAIANGAPLPTALGGFRILVNGSAIPIYAVTPLTPSGTQLNAQLPYEIGPGTVQLAVEQNGVASAAVAVTVSQTAPGIFVFGNNRAVAQNVAPDGSVSVNTADNADSGGRLRGRVSDVKALQ